MAVTTASDDMGKPWRNLRRSLTQHLRFSSWMLPHHLLLLVIAAAVGTPVFFLILGSFSTAELPSEFSWETLGLANYIQVWLDPATYDVFTNTVIYVAGSTILGLSVAVALAWLVERTDMRGKALVYAGVPLTLAIPGMLQAMAAVLLLSPRIGFINQFLDETFGWRPFNIYSLWGMIAVEGLRLVPTAFLMLVPLLRSMDATLEEAAAACGASPLSSLRKITFRLMVPGLLAVMIYQAMTALEVFEIPGILGLPAGIHVFSSKIYSLLNTQSTLPGYGEANALSMLYLMVAVVTTLLYARAIAHSERYAVITGKSYRPRLLQLGRWRSVALGFCILFLFLTAVLPFLVFAYISFLPYLQPPSAEAFALMSWDNYRTVTNAPLIATVLKNTVVMVFVTATATVILSFLISFVVVRTRFWARRLLDQLTFMPHAIPGVVMGIAFIWVFLQTDRLGLIPLYGSIAAICVAFTISFVSYGTRAMNAALLQVHRDVEEAAYTSGASRSRTMLRVFLPLLAPTFVGVWIWVALHAVRVAGLPLLLYEGPNNQVLAVLIWTMWDSGAIEAVGAIGTLLMTVLFAIMLLLRLVGFGQGMSR